MVAQHSCRIGIEVPTPRAAQVLSDIEEAEWLGLHAVWLTMGGPKIADNNFRRDTPSILAAAAVRTASIMLGTAIVLTWPRYPLSFVEYGEVMAQPAPDRFRLGVGPGNKAPIERTYGFEYRQLLGHLEGVRAHHTRRPVRGGSEFQGKTRRWTNRRQPLVNAP